MMDIQLKLLNLTYFLKSEMLMENLILNTIFTIHL